MSNSETKSKKITSKEAARRIYNWILKLESGTVTQATDALCVPKRDGKSYSYCCLGVFENLNRDVLEEEILLDGYFEDYRKYLLSSAELRSSTVDKFGFYGPLGDPFDLGALESLAELNDDGRTFKEIAAILRKKYTSYFEPRVAKHLGKLLKKGK